MRVMVAEIYDALPKAGIDDDPFMRRLREAIVRELDWAALAAVGEK